MWLRKDLILLFPRLIFEASSEKMVSMLGFAAVAIVNCMASVLYVKLLVRLMWVNWLIMTKMRILVG